MAKYRIKLPAEIRVEKHMDKLFFGGKETDNKLVDLIEKALSELTNNTCPHCDRYIGTEDYISTADVEEWLRKKGRE